MSLGIDFEDVVSDDDEMKDDEGTNYQTKFQIGFVMYPEEVQMFEITEYLLTYNTVKKRFRNTDLIEIFDCTLKHTKTNMKIEPYQVQHIMPTASANEMFIG